MPAETLRVSGYRETAVAFARCSVESRATLYAGLRKAADPIALTARQKIGVYRGASTSTIGPKVTARGVYVTQRAKKKTGKRPDFGALQMTRGLLPALSEHQGDIEHDVELAYLALFSKEGF